MLATLKMIFEIKDNETLSYNNAPLLHGVIMERLDADYANILHESTLKPFTQYITREVVSNKYMWIVNTLNEEAYEKILKPLESDSFNSFRINHKNMEVKIENKLFQHISYRDLVHKYYIEETPNRILKINFITPTAFKSMGEYCFMPDIRLLYKSIMNKYDSFSNSYTISSDEVLETLVERTKILDYKLKSTRFHLEGTKIPSFIGEITLKVNGPETMMNLANMLFAYSIFSGVGIKTALGMGAINVLINKI